MELTDEALENLVYIILAVVVIAGFIEDVIKGDWPMIIVGGFLILFFTSMFLLPFIIAIFFPEVLDYIHKVNQS